MTVVRKAETTELATPGENFTRPIASPHLGAAEMIILQQRQEPGGNNPLHFHDREEVMVQLQGTTTVVLGDEMVRLGEGDAVIVPAQVLHQVRNEGDVSAQWLVASPAGSRFFRPDGEEVHAAFLT